MGVGSNNLIRHLHAKNRVQGGHSVIDVLLFFIFSSFIHSMPKVGEKDTRRA
jgi:hypothetical protein